MTDTEETPEAALRRFLVKYQTAIELWDALHFHEGDIPLDAVLVVRLQNATEPGSGLSMSATDGVDFSRQLGMLHEGILIMQQDYYYKGND